MNPPSPGAVKIARLIIEMFGYADDIALVNTMHCGLQDRLDRFDSEFLGAGMEMSLSKTETMTQQYDAHMLHESSFSVRGEKLKEVDSFEYLGGMQSHDDTSHNAVQHRICKSLKAFHMLWKLWKSTLRLSIKGLVYRTFVRSLMLSGAETWTTSQTDLRNLETADMTNIRSILRVSRLQHDCTEYRSED